MNTLRIAIAVITLAALAPATSVAGPYADELARCLVESTTANDRAELVRWMFSAASRHPAVEPYATVTDEQLDAANKILADMVTTLLTESCRSEAQAALKFEGAATIETSFSVLGQVAGRELFTSPEVAAALAGLEKHVDAGKLQALVASE